MGSNKIIVFLCISLGIVLMITSEVAARELAETSTTVEDSKTEETTNGVEEDSYGGGGYGGYPGGGYGGGRGGGGYGGGYGGGRGGGGYGGGYGGGRGGGGYGGGGGGGYCRYGCCRRSYYGGSCRCCSYAGQAVDAEP